MNKRTLFGAFRRSPNQIRLGFVLVGGASIAMASMTIVLFTKISNVILMLEATEKIDLESAAIIRDTMQTSLIFFVAMAVVVAGGGLIFGLKIANRVFGPLVTIQRFIDDLKEGRYDQTLRLRDGDDYDQVAQSLNELAQKLASQTR